MVGSARDRSRELASVSGAHWRRRRALLAMLPALLAWGRAGRDARADVESAPIHIDVETCPAQWDAEIRLAIAVELGDERLAGAARAVEGPAVAGSAAATAPARHRLSGS